MFDTQTWLRARVIGSEKEAIMFFTISISCQFPALELCLHSASCILISWSIADISITVCIYGSQFSKLPIKFANE
jgi:hypothetical protein